MDADSRAAMLSAATWRDKVRAYLQVRWTISRHTRTSYAST